MNTDQIQVENIKCGGCANRIKNKLGSVEGIQNVEVDVETGTIHYTYGNVDAKERLVKGLKSMGYPELGQSNVIDHAKSYVSCMIGRIEKKE